MQQAHGAPFTSGDGVPVAGTRDEGLPLWPR